MENQLSIGWIGTGIMGTAMAGNLLKKGFKVAVYNRTKSKTKTLSELGASVVDAPNVLWKYCDVIFVMLTNDSACEAMLTQTGGILDSVNGKGKIIVNCSTISPKASERFAEMANAHQIDYLDAPVSGSAGAAKEGTLLFLVGGKEASFEMLIPLFNAMGKKNYYLGGVSQGNKAKLAINYLVAINYLAIGETVHFAEQIGIVPKDMMDIINNSGVGNITSKIKTDPIVNDDFHSIAFSLDNMLKDINLAKAEGNHLPLSEPLLDAYLDASNKGYGSMDVMEILTYLRKVY